jgi:hypothetical protein
VSAAADPASAKMPVTAQVSTKPRCERMLRSPPKDGCGRAWTLGGDQH